MSILFANTQCFLGKKRRLVPLTWIVAPPKKILFPWTNLRICHLQALRLQSNDQAPKIPPLASGNQIKSTSPSCAKSHFLGRFSAQSPRAMKSNKGFMHRENIINNSINERPISTSIRNISWKYHFLLHIVDPKFIVLEKTTEIW